MDRLFTLGEVSRHTGIPLRSLADGARAKPPKFEHVYLGGRHLMTEAQVRKLIDANTVTVEPKPDVDRMQKMHARMQRRAARK